jgi:hypothetical protein
VRTARFKNTKPWVSLTPQRPLFKQTTAAKPALAANVRQEKKVTRFLTFAGFASLEDGLSASILRGHIALAGKSQS